MLLVPSAAVALEAAAEATMELPTDVTTEVPTDKATVVAAAAEIVAATSASPIATCCCGSPSGEAARAALHEGFYKKSWRMQIDSTKHVGGGMP